jgi:CBS domain-containing protein
VKVEELMSTDVVTVTPETTLKEVASLLDEHRISGVPVCDAAGGVVGIVSESDILWKELRTLPEAHGLIDRLLDSAYGDDKRARATTAGEAMSSPAITVSPDVSIARAAQLMLECMVNRLPVIGGGRLVGILTRSDLVRAFKRSDAEVEREIQTLLRELWVDPARLTITVRNGDVAVAGEVENRFSATSLERHLARVPGVVGVRSELRWDVDDRSHRVAAAADRLTRRV